MPYRFETVDVFTDARFGGNPLAVFIDADGLGDAEMQALAAEMNLSETSFILPPADPANTARVRIFNRAHEMPFAGHPSIGTACVLARLGRVAGGEARLEVPAGLVRVAIETGAGGMATGGRLTAPQPLAIGPELDPAAAAACAGLAERDVLTRAHRPVQVSAGVDFVVAEVAADAIGRALPDIAAFRAALQPWMEGRLSLLIYAREGAAVHARMFAPLAGTWEDPATGSAASALAALLLSLDGGDAAEFTMRQGVEMGRPSLLRPFARRTGAGVTGGVGGGCVPVFRGEYG
ncbi:PhzF family phenazine biosynthesis protein [Sphingomonas canadensis]|uniref:PhzF family phenazine biosynthesis protein n=1 Tax=Sphingomonas canadensis TaxID=1219257 RepID=A0ABW3H1F6_9SPHN|nr:PhzF family phenazine biosynthesis protein [Sphingomonas canadensis]MCW3835123.1 PhzF family phenazine biosynthesis protein [Sphingomonas canadensis]